MAAGFAVLLGVLVFLSAGVGGRASAAVRVPGLAAIPPEQAQVQGAAKAQSTVVARIAGTWQDIAPFPNVSIPPTPGTNPLRLKRANAAAYHPNGKLYVLGGRAGTDGDDTTLRNIFEYTPSSNSWVQKAALLDEGPVGSRWTANMAVAVLTDTSGVRIYAIGGTNIDAEPSNRVRVYNPTADTVTLLTGDAWPALPPRNPGAWAVYNNKLYIYGGFSSIGQGGVFPETWVFDPMAPAGSKWQQLTSANLPTARGYMAGALLDGYIYAIGGNTWITSPRTLVPSNLVHRMNPALPSPTWTAVANLPTARGDMGAWAYDTGTNYEISGRIAIAGGVFPTPDAQGYLYNPGTNSWSIFPNMTHATRNYGFAQLNGYLYAFGGYDYTAGLPQGANWNQRYDATQPGGSPTPTATRTNTPIPPTSTSTPTITPTCGVGANYVATLTGGNTIIPATNLVPGSICHACVVGISLPFPYTFYDQTFTTANVSPKGTLQFVSSLGGGSNVCLPTDTLSYAIVPFWDDFSANPVPLIGVYTELIGTAPNRTFIVQWRMSNPSGPSSPDWELLLYEGQPRFDVVYGSVPGRGASATIGAQESTGGGGNRWVQWSCNQLSVQLGDRLAFDRRTCP
jgi:N-acetylneuraminic acid mutarotase